MGKEPRVGVGVFVVKEGKILLGQRINSHGSGTWSIPGGHLEFFEDFETCAKREVLEETGLRIKDVSFVAVTNDLFAKEEKHYITIFLKSKYVSGVPLVLEPDKCLKWEWVDFDDLPSPLFIPLKNFVEAGFSPFK